MLKIPGSSCARKETVDIEILVASSSNGDRKIMQSIRIASRLPSKKRKWNSSEDLVYINNFPNGLNTNTKLFRYCFLLLLTQSIYLMTLSKIREWTIKWKMRFDPIPTTKIKRSISVVKSQREITYMLVYFEKSKESFL